jgi:hypothetical protein
VSFRQGQCAAGFDRHHWNHVQPASRFSERRSVDLPTRLALATCALVVLLYPSERVAATACLPVVLIIAYWILWRRPAATLDMAKGAGTTAFAASFAKPESAARMD